MPSSNVPFTYAVRSENTIYLYLLVYSGSTAPTFSMDSPPVGQTQGFTITTSSVGNTPYFERFSFPAGNLTKIKIECDNHTRIIVVADIDVDAMPDESTDHRQALEVPYAYTVKAIQNNPDKFKVEIVLFSQTPKYFKCTHIGPDVHTDTISTIENSGGTNATAEFSCEHIFTQTNYVTTEGTHDATYQDTGGKKRKSKTKNKYHSPTPFP